MHVWMREALCPKAWNPASPATSLQFQDWLFYVMFPSRGKTSLIYQAGLISTEADERLLWMAVGSGRWAGALKSRVAGQAGGCWCSRMRGWEALGGCNVLQEALRRICGLTLLSAGLP